jgi:hypothetical protein
VNTELNTTTEHQVPVSIAPATPPNGAVISDATGEVAPLLPPIPVASKSFEEMTSLEKMEHFNALAYSELLNAKHDLADDLKKVIGAIKSLNVHGHNGVFADPLFQEEATFLKAQLSPQPEPASAGQSNNAGQPESKRVDAVVRRLLKANAPMTESEIIKELPDFDADKIRKTLKNRSAGKTPCFKCDNNKWKVINK